MTQCAWCLAEFTQRTSSQIYHTAECRRLATKQKIADSYKRKRRKQKVRHCANGCGTILSQYNDSKFCTICQVNPKLFKDTMREIKGLMNGKVH